MNLIFHKYKINLFNICAKPFRYFSLPLILVLGKPQWGDQAGQAWSLCVFIQHAQSWKNSSAEDARAGTPRRWAPWGTGQVSSPTGAFPTNYECAEAFLTTLPFRIPFQGKLRRAKQLWGRSPAPKLLLARCVCRQQDLWAGAAVLGRVLHVAARPCLSWLILPLHSAGALVWALPLVRGPRIKQDHTPPRLETAFWKCPFPEGFKSNSG